MFLFKLFLVTLFSFILVDVEVDGFTVGRAFSMTARTTKSRCDASTSNQEPVDLSRAKDCADHFGKCSVDEMKELKEGLHRERLQQFMFGSPSTSDTVAWEESLDYRLLEEELDLQLGMLESHEEAQRTKHNKESLFPEVEDPMLELPHLKDNTLSKKAEEMVHNAEVTLAMEETVLEESTLETAAICAIIALVALMPGILQHI